MFLEFVEDLDNPAKGSSSVGDNSGIAQPSVTPTPKRRARAARVNPCVKAEPRLRQAEPVPVLFQPSRQDQFGSIHLHFGRLGPSDRCGERLSSVGTHPLQPFLGIPLLGKHTCLAVRTRRVNLQGECRHVEVHAEEVVGEAEVPVVASRRRHLLHRQSTQMHRSPRRISPRWSGAIRTCCKLLWRLS
ncbi:uncharacterized protein LOC127148409 [Cucumis melo]|uniref:Uncharacterized protein LOC127148409 n=1 Tax=Cucumis melo TaxID=3656 RepID=A0ABM3KJG8_CUCME|nr:uncharacterized protein LOC127148409 [Cucumis melo]